MDKLNTKQSPDSEISQEPSADQIKLTMKQRLSRLLMSTERKDKSLIPELITIKNAMHENFCHTGSWQSSYINDIFRLYMHKNQDITISKPQLALFSQYAVNIPDVPSTDPIKITQYIKTLRFVRAWLQPLIGTIRSLVTDAKHYWSEQMKTEGTAIYNTSYDMEDDKQKEHKIAKEYLKKSMSSQKYNHDWFLQEQAIIAGTPDANNYQDLMAFALLWFHYFGKKSEVYDSFLPQQLETTKVSFTLPGFHPTNVTLWTFLKIIEHLDFKKHLFAV